MIWDRERYLAHMHFEYTGAEMFCELFGPLVGLEEEWRRQGASAKEIALTAFDWDYVLKAFLDADCGAVTGIQPHILRDDPQATLSVDRLGRRVKLCKGSATIAHPISYPVRTMEDWLAVKHWYTFREERIDRSALEEKKRMRDRGYMTLLSVPGGFDEPRELMGEAQLCLACYDEPEMIHDILTTIGDTAVQVMERVGEIVPIDCLVIHEDMAGKSGPLFGPRQVKEFMEPYYRRIWSCAQSCGASLFSQDSDGDMTPIIDAMLDCGINSMHPFEPAAGMDMVKIRSQYGQRLSIKGGIDKFALRGDREAIRRELEYKICLTMLRGGTVFALDHRIPNGVPIENYRYYVNYGRELLGKPPISGEGWERMAF